MSTPDICYEILVERNRKKAVEGFTTEHDDQYPEGVLSRAGASYAKYAYTPLSDGGVPAMWPWHESWWKRTNARRDLVKAAALIVAEIERIDRKLSESNQ